MGQRILSFAAGALFCFAIGANAQVRLTGRPELHSFYAHGADGIATRDSRGMFVWFAGTGGAQSYGIESSMAPILHHHHDAGWDAVAAENPLYWLRQESAAVRGPFLDRFGRLEAQLEWVYRVVEEAVAASDPGKRIFLGGRSMGAGLLMEGLYRYVRGDRGAAIFGRVEGILVYGLHGHTAEDIDMFMRTEYLEHTERPNTMDPLVLPYGPLIYRAMGFAPEHPTAVRLPEGTPIPRVLGVLSKRDQYLFPWEARATYSRIMRRMPQVNGWLVNADTRHDISEGSRYHDELDPAAPLVRSYAPLTRFAPVVDMLVAGDASWRRPNAGQWTELFLPERDSFEGAPICRERLARYGAVPDSTLRSFFAEYFRRQVPTAP